MDGESLRVAYLKTQNMPVDQFVEYVRDREVYIYGVGDFYQRLSTKVVYQCIHKSVAGYIDNGQKGEKITVSGVEYRIQGIEFLRTVRKGIVLLCGTTYLEEMYQQLVSQRFSDEIECFIMPLVWAVSDGRDDPEVIKCISLEDNSTAMREKRTKEKIDKKIHCCWFSGEKKPEKYQRCIDTWKRICPDYEIIEWNASNYDCEKNLFMKQAYRNRKWAFVSDYARLDVVYSYGGIYLDMDVELLKDFKPLLGYDAFFNYGVRHMIELGSGFGSVKGNPFIGRLIGTYENEEFVDRYGKPQADKFVQPRWLNDCFEREGFWMNGDMQLANNMLLLPRRFYTPKDDFLLLNWLQCRDTRGIHHFNSEWRSDEYLNGRTEITAWIAAKCLGNV